MSVYITPYVNLNVETGIYASGDALGEKNSFPNVPEHGTIMAVNVIDRDSEAVNLDLVLFSRDIAGTADNAAFAPSDAELSDCQGAVLVDTWKTFSTNSLGSESNVALPYWAPTGSLYFQCVTRGTPTFTATTDVLVQLGIVF